MKIGSLFSGIGGLELGLERSGLGETVWQVEQNEFCREILKKHWPNVERFKDVCEVGKHNLVPVDLLCGGFPCQDISSAGKGAGLAGERSGLWHQFARIIGELRPRWVVVENVASGAKRWVDAVVRELGELGYAALPIPLSAEDVGAPHKRARVFIVAHTDRPILRIEPRRGAIQPRPDGEASDAANSDSDSEPTLSEHAQVEGVPTVAVFGWWARRPTPLPVRRVDDGLSAGVDPAIKALGNAVVPQCAEIVGYVIKELIYEGG